MWTQFWDMHSGGGLKEKWQFIYIEAPESEAKSVFYSRFGHNPERVTCTCCGRDYSISEGELDQLTAYHRNCDFDDKLHKYAERRDKGKFVHGKYQTVDEYCKNPDVHIIRAEEIKPEERTVDVPEQGYAWRD
jgi:hypothetical protein